MFHKLTQSVKGGIMKAKDFARNAPQHYQKLRDIGASVAKGIDIAKKVADTIPNQQVQNVANSIYQTKNNAMQHLERVDGVLKQNKLI